MQRSFQLRFFEERDLNQVIHINWTCLPENYSSYFFLDLHRRFPETFLVAEVKQKVVGYIMCRMEQGFSELRKVGLAKKGHIVSVAVLPEYRGMGVGTALVVNAMRGMKTYNATECFLEVRVTNTPAISLYKKLGFKPTRRIGAYYHDGESAYVMTRKLPFEEEF